MSRFSDADILRYGRQMVLPEVGGVGQERIRAVHAVAAGEVEALYLAAAGVGALTVPTERVAEAVRALNPAVDVRVAPIESIDEDVRTQSLRALAVVKEALGL
jgi:hypothetical protein